MSFRHGDSVRLKDCPPDREPVGKITGCPRVGTYSTHVTWPDGWSGWELLDNLEHAKPFDIGALRAARAAWLPSEEALLDAHFARALATRGA